jgi:outer membrane receptor protein involved in Fe transport
MGKNRVLQLAVRAALAAAAASAAVPVAYSQTAPATTAAAPAGESELTEVVVTGSRLQTANLVSISPIVTVTNLQIEQSGLTRVEDILNNLPSVFASQNNTLSNGSDGTATIDLHDLGVQRTLTLVNGKRLAPGSPDGRNYADINQIPAELIERVDVLTGGASSTYGADAVAGVVNFVMNDHYEGVKIDAQYGFFNHSNHEGQYQALETAGNDPTASGSVNAGYSKHFSIVAGSNFADNMGNATFYTTFDKQNSVLGSQYDYSACSLSTKSHTLGGAVCAGSGTDAGGTLLAYNSVGKNILTDNINSATKNVAPRVASDLYDFGALNYWERPNERWTAGSFMHLDVNEHTTVYAELMYMRNSSTSGIAPSGDFADNSLSINCGAVGPGLAGNPLINAQQRSVLCAPALLAAQGQPAGGILGYYLLRRNVEGGQRLQSFENDDYHTDIGVKGDFLSAFKYDAYAQVGITDATSQNANYFSTANLAFAENPVTNTAGQIVCAAPAPANCVPYNPWAVGGVTPAALKYLTIPLQDQGSAREYVVHADVTADLGKFGLQLPIAKSGPQINLGAEYRSESTVFSPDLAEQEGLGAGGAGDVLPIAGNFHVSEAFLELNIPIADDLPGAYQAALTAGYRYSKYTLGFTTNTYKFGVEWAPVQDIRFRANYNQAVRAPNISELFSAATIGPGGSIDPCWGPTPTLTPAQCAKTGVTAAEYGNLGINPASQFNVQSGGNPQLSPEIAHTWTYGLVFQPTFLPSFYTSIDYYDIRITGAIEAQSGVSIILNCALTGNATDCADIHRDPANGSLWLTNAGFVTTSSQNTGVLETKGVDVSMHYGLNMNELGKLAFDLTGTDTILRTLQPNVTAIDPTTGATGPGQSYNCTGYFGVTCLNPLPRWRSVFTVDWATPWTGLDLNLRWRYIGDTQVDALSQSPLLSSPSTVTPGYSHIPSYNYLDLSAAVTVAQNVTVRVGANNVLDKDPPVILSANCPVGPCNNNSFGGTYDPIGRFLYVHVTAKF